MAVTVVALNTSNAVGSKLDPEMIAEIEAVAPSNIDPGEVKAVHIDEEAVERDKIKLGAVDSPQIAEGGVKAINLGAESVTTAKLAPNSVTPEKTGPGIMECRDTAGNPLSIAAVPITALAYAALTTPDPNVLYLLTT